MDRDKKQIEAKINDCTRLCEKYACARFTAFLTEEEQAEFAYAADGVNTLFFGGYDDAKRKVFGAFPEWQEIDRGEYPIAVISVEKKYPKELTHREYLGTILSLGLERDTIGDILVHEGGAYVFCLKSVEDTLRLGIDKISNCGVKVKSVSVGEIEIPQQEYDDLFCVAASMRLDALVSAVTKLSRAKAAELIRASKVSLNHKETEDVSKGVETGDTLSVRGFGKYVVFSEDGKTGSGRLHVHIKKFR